MSGESSNQTVEEAIYEDEDDLGGLEYTHNSENPSAGPSNISFSSSPGAGASSITRRLEGLALDTPPQPIRGIRQGMRLL